MCVIIARNVPASADEQRMRAVIEELKAIVRRTFPSYAHEVSVLMYPSSLSVQADDGRNRPVVSLEMVSEGEKSRGALSHLLGLCRNVFLKHLGSDPECYVRGMVVHLR